jgi:hypothetical protein
MPNVHIRHDSLRMSLHVGSFSVIGNFCNQSESFCNKSVSNREFLNWYNFFLIFPQLIFSYCKSKSLKFFQRYYKKIYISMNCFLKLIPILLLIFMSKKINYFICRKRHKMQNSFIKYIPNQNFFSQFLLL